jgi:predicted aspartyl protease
MAKWSAVAVVSAVAVPAAVARCHMENVTAIPVASNGNQLLTSGVIDGHPVTVLIDTGAYMSFIWRPAAERLNLHLVSAPRLRLYGLGGESRVDATFVGELQVQSFTAKGLRLPVAGDVPSSVDFVFGENFLARDSVEFDVRHGFVRTMETSGCTPAELPYWSKTYSMADLIASPRDAQAIRVPVVLNGHEFRAQLDSGSSVTLVTKSVADAAGLQYVSSSEQIVGIGHRTLESWIADVSSFRLGDETIDNTQLRVAQLDKYQTMGRLGTRIPVAAGTPPSILLGMDFLRSHRVLIDNTTRKMVFTYEGGPVFQITKPPESDAAPSDSTRAASVGN